ncbi:hypothetical protein Agub_g13532 [Astrephomene gubernaculifera]|uniref:Uncharacterized protein n=1 Tax=Astrephomene gubernaculifera TaxID=47775 RepID=A0AAD3E209_9CHLO|nr:hypothetical protein Agub_g13532 [Astrephomene gubernaculifera]
MARLHIHPVGLALLFLGLVSWVVALGGLGASTRDCIVHGSSNTTLNGTPAKCANTYQLEWWSIWFEFILLVIMILTCFTQAFDRARHIYLTYLGMVTVLLTIMSKNFITNSFSVDGWNFKDYKADAYNAAAAGGVMLCITNFALIIFVGLGASSPSANSGSGSAGPLSLQVGSSAPVEQKYQPSTYQPANF